MTSLLPAIVPVETWRSVDGFPAYAVSDLGRVKRILPSARNHACRVLSPWLNNKGYAIISLTQDRMITKRGVHQLVCRAFHGPKPTDAHEVAHGDGNPLNNRASNLRWATRSENMADARRHGTLAIGPSHGRSLSPEKTPRGERHGHAKLSEGSVREIRAAKTFPGSGRMLAQRFGVSPATICLVRAGKIWSHIIDNNGVPK